MDALVEERANALHPDDREEQYKESRSYAARERRARKRAGMVGWWIGGIGTSLAIIATTTTLVVVLRNKDPIKKFFEVDSSTGWVGEAVGAADAPKLFSERVAHRSVREYIEAREGYVPETDPAKWKVVRAMSSNDEFERYKAWRKTDLAPVKGLATGGHVEVGNYHYSKPTTGKDGTISYTVRYQRQEVKGDAIGPVTYWHADVDFQWHPEMTQTDEDEQLNPEGFQAVAFKSQKDS